MLMLPLRVIPLKATMSEGSVAWAVGPPGHGATFQFPAPISRAETLLEWQVSEACVPYLALGDFTRSLDGG